MKRLSVVLALSAAAWAESGISLPRLGYYRDPRGALRPLYGVAGSFVPGPAALTGVLSAACSGRAVLVKTAHAVEWRDMELRLVARWPAPKGPARFVFKGPDTAIAHFAVTGETVRYQLRQLPRPEPDSQPLATPEELPVASPAMEQVGEEWWALDGRRAVRLRGGKASEYRIPEAAQTPALELTMPAGKTAWRPGDTIDLGTAEVDQAVTTTFRITNTTEADIRLEAGDIQFGNQETEEPARAACEAAAVWPGFLIANLPPMPEKLYAIGPDGMAGHLEFDVEFKPQAAAGYQAWLCVKRDGYRLVGRGSGGGGGSLLSLMLDGQTLAPGAQVEFAAAESKTFVVANNGGQAAAVPVSVSGPGFTVDATSLTVPAGGQQSFHVTFEPVAPPCCDATLAAGQLTAHLHGNPAQAAIPKFRIAIEPAVLASAQQATLALKFDAASPAQASGLVRMDFIGKGDTSRGFITGDSKQAQFTIEVGEDTARFGGAASIGFQPGTTAGTILFTATLGLETEEASIQIAAAPVGVDSVRLTHGPASVMVSVTGWDNTRTAGPATFTFRDTNGAALGSTIQADATQAFEDYFANAGNGSFVLRAQFPVSGTVTAIDAVDVTLANSAGGSQAHGKMTE